MKLRTALIILGIALLVAVIALIAYFALRMYSDPSAPGTDTDPFGGFNSSSTPIAPGTPVRVLETPDGSSFKVPDFTIGHPSVNAPAGTYYAVSQDAEGNEESDSYSIVYGTDSSISIGLLTEPLGQARHKAEDRLRELIPLSEVELCKLTVTVMASPRLNDTYAGVDLGLSFCPGAVVLP
jgi:hypothetical protein